jgi:murein DD-endopeptidase MepM/ murein hydrolase activator NlpD
MMGRHFRRGVGLLLVWAGTVFICGTLFADDEIIHVMKGGETIYGLSREYGVKIEEILFINGIDDARKVKSGQHIRIPSPYMMAAPLNPDQNAPSVVELHQVQKGETFFGLSKRYGVSIEDILRINNLPASYVLKMGDVLKIPLESQNTKVAPPPANMANAPQPVITEPAGTVKIDLLPPSAREVNLSLIWPINPKDAAYMTGKLSGIAMVGEQGEGVYCIFPGTVVSAGPYRGFGRVVIVKSIEGYMYVYGGCETLFVRAGDTVATGTELGRLGIDAVSGQAALFFMVYLNNIPVDPATAPRD